MSFLPEPKRPGNPDSKCMKYLASDFDGTLYFQNQGIREEDREAIKRFQKEGNCFGICSGRPYIGMKRYLEDIEADFYIQNGGAHIVDKYGNTLFAKGLDRKVVDWILDHNTGYPAVFFGKKDLYFNTVLPESLQGFAKGLDDLMADPEETIFGVSVICGSDIHAEYIAQEISKMKGVQANVNSASVDIMPEGCSKIQGIKQACELLGIDDMACIGDSFNDIPMLKVCPESFTFESSPAPVQESAAHTVRSLAQAIDYLEHMA